LERRTSSFYRSVFVASYHRRSSSYEDRTEEHRSSMAANYRDRVEVLPPRCLYACSFSVIIYWGWQLSDHVRKLFVYSDMKSPACASDCPVLLAIEKGDLSYCKIGLLTQHFQEHVTRTSSCSDWKLIDV